MKIAITATVIFCVAILMAMTGRGGGNFYVLVLVTAGVTIHRAATIGQLILVATTALMGFLGHTISGDFNATWAIPSVLVASVGGLLGAKFSIKAKPKKLKLIFGYTTLAAAVVMFGNAMLSVSK